MTGPGRPTRPGGRDRGRLAMALSAVAVAAALPGPGTASADPAPVLVGCDQAAVRIQVTVDTVLDPGCTYTAGLDVTASHVTLDCAGAHVQGPPGVGGVGIEVSTPVDVALTDVTVRRCDVAGFTNGIKVTRDGFRTLAAGHELDHPTSDIAIEDAEVHDTRGVGVYVDGWVTGVTIRRVRIHGAGSSGIYLETGSQGSQVVDNAITGNGFRENGPDGQTTSLGGTTVWYWGPGREGISVDGSAGNRIAGNTLSGNSAGGIFLYKNCGEYHLSRPDRWFDRRLHADGNVIEGNRISDGPNGVWVGSRMGENTLPMECSDPAYVDQPGRRIVLDFARGNVVRDNEFVDVTYGVRVEDDDTTVAGNRFRAGDGTHHAVVIGTPYRTAVLGRPVRGTVLTANEADIVGNPNPYRWVHGQADTTVAGNRALGRPVGICEGPALPRGPFVMVLAVAAPLPGGGKPPTPDLALPAVGPLPACPGPGTDPPGATTTSVPGTGPGPAAVAPGARPIGGAPTYTG